MISFVNDAFANADAGYVLPHLVNYEAIACAYKQLRVANVVALYSTGSLKPNINVGSILIPDDYFALSGPPVTLLDNPEAHVGTFFI